MWLSVVSMARVAELGACGMQVVPREVFSKIFSLEYNDVENH